MPLSTGPIGASLSAAVRFISTAASTKAADIVSRGTVRGHHDVAYIGRQLADQARQDPAAAAETKQAVLALLTPVEQGALERTLSQQQVPGQQVDAQTALQRDNFPEYARQLRPTLAPQDRDNPFAYSLGADVPIEIKRQVFAEYRANQNAPTVELARMSGANASFDESRGQNGTIQINSDLLGNPGIAGQPGQFEAFAVWGHLEEVGHWGDMRAQQLMGRPGGDAVGDEGARFALMSLSPVTNSANPQTFLANYDIALSNGTTRSVQVDTVVLRALAANKVASGSFARENRIGGTEHFGPEGHYQTVFLTADGVKGQLENWFGSLDGYPGDLGDAASLLAVGAQLPDMIEQFDAHSLFNNSLDGMSAAEMTHLRAAYRGLHGLPFFSQDGTAQWIINERQATGDYIRTQMRNGSFLEAGIATHRYGDLYSHTKEDGTGFPSILGHGPQSVLSENGIGNAVNPDDIYYNAERIQNTRNYQSSMAQIFADGFADRIQITNPRIVLRAGRRNELADAGRKSWSDLFDKYLKPESDDIRSQDSFFKKAQSIITNQKASYNGGRYPLITVDPSLGVLDQRLQLGVEGWSAAPSTYTNGSASNAVNSVMDTFSNLPPEPGLGDYLELMPIISPTTVRIR